LPRKKIELTDDQIKDAIMSCDTIKEQAEYLNVCEDVYRREKGLYEQRRDYKEQIKGLTTRDPKLELTKERDIKAFKEDCYDIYKRSRKTIGYNEVTFDLGDDDCGVKVDCDWHIGNEMTRIDKWSDDIELTVKTPRLFTVLTGDYTDNLDAINKGYESIITVPEAKQKVRNAVSMMGNKILGVIQGCHDEWFYTQDSWDIAQYLADHSEGYWLGFRGIINLIVGEQKYSFYARHKYRRHSTDNLSWGMLYKFRKIKKNPIDVMMGGHHHYAIAHSNFECEQKVYFLMGGSYKPYDRFTEHKDIEPAPALMPSVYLRADKHEITQFIDFREMVDLLL
jgi:hypothetical protein